MSERAVHLSRTADRQITEVIDILAICDEAALRLPCPGREELGDGSVAACARHTAHNYRRIGRFLATTDRLSAGHTTGEPGAHRLPRFLRTLGHDAVEQSRHGPDGHDHHEQYKAENTSPADLIEQLSARTSALSGTQ